MMMSFISVAIGGACGAMMRYGISLYFASPTALWPAYMATLSVNIAGCALMGVLAAFIHLHPGLSDNIRPALMVGFLGALTTFSSFALDSFGLMAKQQYLILTLYMGASFILSLGAFFIGYQLTKGLVG